MKAHRDMKIFGDGRQAAQVRDAYMTDVPRELRKS
jgi:hypothetical protein